MLRKHSALQTVALYFIAVLFVIFNLSNAKLTGLIQFFPLCDLMIIFYFSIFKRVYGVGFIFLLGIWSDALSGTVLGVSSLLYIVLIKLFILFNDKMMISENFKQVWQQFLIFSFLFLLMKYLILSAFNGSLFAFVPVMIHFFISGLFYVVMHSFFDYLSKKLLNSDS